MLCSLKMQKILLTVQYHCFELAPIYQLITNFLLFLKYFKIFSVTVIISYVSRDISFIKRCTQLINYDNRSFTLIKCN